MSVRTINGQQHTYIIDESNHLLGVVQLFVRTDIRQRNASDIFHGWGFLRPGPAAIAVELVVAVGRLVDVRRIQLPDGTLFFEYR